MKNEEGRKKKRTDTDLHSKAQALADAKACGGDPSLAQIQPSLRAMVISAALRCGNDREQGEVTRPKRVLMEVLRTWGHIFEEAAHPEYSWRVKGLKGVVEGKGVVEEFEPNPRRGRTLKLAKPFVELGEAAKVRGYEEGKVRAGREERKTNTVLTS